jgi:hypothetical protein
LEDFSLSNEAPTDAPEFPNELKVGHQRSVRLPEKWRLWGSSRFAPEGTYFGDTMI